ncbi:PEP-CTERM sorting domain-containing protein [Roseateles sp. BYS78W]|uniref:PEP-CTERM sorting domain-containing protein n=1 Tax=Pelomonas candidula TaxID=3299025 RepID=A0ABW7HCZ4_9BURK
MNNANSLPNLLAGLALASSLSAGAQSLQVNYANAGESVADTATCLSGIHPSGDLRGCSGAITSTSAMAGTTLHGEGHAQWSNGINSQAWATAGFGSLKAFAETSNPGVSDARNTQSRGAASMADFITASNAGGAPVTVYNYAVTVHGTLSPWLTVGGITDAGRNSAYVNFVASPICFACNNVVDNRSLDIGVSSFTYGGSFSAPTGTKIQIGLGLDVWTYAAVPAGTAVTETADFGSTVTLHIDGVTPGANTVGASGFNYATAPVPEPASALLWLLGLAGLAARTRRSSITQEASS